MVPFILRRVLLVIPVMLGVSIAAFLMSHLVPGDPVSVMLGETATAEDRERLREELGFNDPLIVQYGRYIGGVLQGDLGTSIRSGQPVLDEIVERLPSTATLTLSAVVVAAVVGVTLGVVAAVRGGGWVDALIMGFAMLGISVPTFWSGILLILLFGLVLGWFPIAGGRADGARAADRHVGGSFSRGPGTNHTIQRPGSDRAGFHSIGPIEGTFGEHGHSPACPSQRVDSRDHDYRPPVRWTDVRFCDR